MNTTTVRRVKHVPDPKYNWFQHVSAINNPVWTFKILNIVYGSRNGSAIFSVLERSSKLLCWDMCPVKQI